MALTNIVRYFRDCYEADNKRTTVWNIFHRSVEHRIFARETEELLTGLLPYRPVDPEKGLAAKKAAYLYRKERDLVYCSLFVVGCLSDEDEQREAVCAPLLIHPADFLEKDTHVFLKPDLANRQVNHRLLDRLQDATGEISLSHRVTEELAGEFVTREQIAGVAQLLEHVVPGLDGSELYHFPALISERELRSRFKSAEADPDAPLRVLPGSVAALVRKSLGTRGVLNELSTIAEQDSVSVPLRILFGSQSREAPSTAPVSVGRVPAVLSRAQKRILELAATNPVTLVIGPPGTGKSYTIAALAMEHLTRGQSVLIASKMNHAVDVVGNKIEQQLGIQGCVVRGGRKQYLKDLKTYLQQLLSGMHTAETVDWGQVRRLERDLSRLDRSIASLERRITKLSRRELSRGRFLMDRRPGVLNVLRTRYIGWKAKRRTPLWGLVDRLDRRLEERIQKTTRLIQLLNRRRLDESLRRHRPEFTTFLKAIRARTGGKQEDLFNTIDFRVLFRAFPVWLVNLSDVYDVLPLKQGLFDLAIIDEATQCDIASSLPILQRAKRVVITGDPNQLRYLSFLSKERQGSLMEKYGVGQDQADLFDYREKSILDFVNETITEQDHVAFLDEHYRSAPPIIRFSNKTFYGGSLRVMTEKPGIVTDWPLTLRRVNGQRNAAGENEEEAHRLMEDVIRLVEIEKSLGPELCHSIGILSPFRSQVDYIVKALSGELPWDEFDKHDILIGTAHAFQGEERDVMFLSLAVDSNAHAATMRFLDKPDVFNVSITRARVAQHVYVSRDPEQLSSDSLVGSYLRFIGEPDVADSERPTAAFDRPLDAFAADVEAALADRGFKTWSAYPVAGLTMDIVVASRRDSCGIDLVGHPGVFEAAFPLERYRMFHRAGLRVFPLAYSRWVWNRNECLTAIENTLHGSGRSSEPRESRTIEENEHK